jgi:predicted HAD superfamily Cof-like phosphohydrolase
MTEIHYPDYQAKAVAEFMSKGRQATPLFPTIPSLEIRKLRAKLILEEAIETANALGFSVWIEHDALGCHSVMRLSESFNPSLMEIADGCSDIRVVTVGTELACGINGKPVFEEVMRSNMTKDFSGMTRGDGKIMKGEAYEPPNIEKVLHEQGWKP